MKENLSSDAAMKIAYVMEKLKKESWYYEGYQGYRISIVYSESGAYIIEEGAFLDLHEIVLSEREMIAYLESLSGHKIFDWIENKDNESE